MRESRLDKARRFARKARLPDEAPKVINSLDDLARVIVHETKPLLPTQREFIFCADRIALFMGPVGSAKSVSLAAATILPALLYPGSRWGVFRANWWTMEETTLKTFHQAFDRLGPGLIVDRQVGPPYKVWIASAVEGGEPSEFVFHSLDDIGKLGSQEFTGVSVDEASEIDEGLITTLNGRLRWKRQGQETADGPYFLRMVTNPVRRSHWIHKRFCGEPDCDPVPMGRKFKPRHRENEANLPRGYYDQIAATYRTPEMRMRMVEGECGPDPTGQPVFGEFSYDMHVGNLKFIEGLPMIRGWDFGRRRPACVFAQLTPDGCLNRLFAMLGENEHIHQFITKVRMRSSVMFPRAPTWVDYCDASGARKTSTSDKSDIDYMNEAGIYPRWKLTAIKTGIDLMATGLATVIKGRPRSMFDRHGCNLLIEGYAGGYTYADARAGTALKEEPLKDGFYEHLMDADRYIEVGIGLGSNVPLDAHKRNLSKRRAE
jgi:hypothetical protein